MEKKTNWEIYLTVIGVVIACLALLRDLTAFEINGHSEKGVSVSEQTNKINESKSYLHDSFSRQRQYSFNDNDVKNIDNSKKNQFLFDTLSISKKVLVTINEDKLIVLKENKGKINIDFMIPITNVNKIGIRKDINQKTDSTLNFILLKFKSISTEDDKIYYTDISFNESLFKQFVEYKILTRKPSIIVDTKVFMLLSPILALPFIVVLLLTPSVVKYTVENVLKKQYKIKYSNKAMIFLLLAAAIFLILDFFINTAKMFH